MAKSCSGKVSIETLDAVVGMENFRALVPYSRELRELRLLVPYRVLHFIAVCCEWA